MYYRDDSEQLTMEEFFQPFGGRLRKDNRWVCLAGIMPWEYIEEIYVKNLSGETGRPAISSRIAFGPIFIKEFCHLAKTIPQILAARCQLPLELPQPAVAVRYHRKNFIIIIILHACMYYKT